MPTKLNYQGKGFVISAGDSILNCEILYRSPYAEGNTLDWGNEEDITAEQAIEYITQDVQTLKFILINS